MTEAAPPYAAGSRTSREAADAIADDAAAGRGRVFAVLHAEGDRGLTDKEMQRLLGLKGDTQRPRRWELVKRGIVVDSGRTRVEASDNGKRKSKSTVWIINPELNKPGQLELLR